MANHYLRLIGWETVLDKHINIKNIICHSQVVLYESRCLSQKSELSSRFPATGKCSLRSLLIARTISALPASLHTPMFGICVYSCVTLEDASDFFHSLNL